MMDNDKKDKKIKKKERKKDFENHIIEMMASERKWILTFDLRSDSFLKNVQP